MADANLKRCPKCGETKTFDLFFRCKTAKNGCSPYCKACSTIRTMRYARDNAHKIQPHLKKYTLMRRYGMTLDDYLRMLEGQNYACAICKTAKCPTGRNFAVDHCHATGKVRGLLCGHCNQGLGVFRDDTARMQRAIEYLNTHAKEPQG